MFGESSAERPHVGVIFFFFNYIYMGLVSISQTFRNTIISECIILYYIIERKSSLFMIFQTFCNTVISPNLLIHIIILYRRA